MGVETIEDASDVIVGTFPVNLHPATVLFGSGASHAFIFASFVKKTSMIMQPMRNTMVVNSPGGDLRATLYCPKVTISIRG